MRREDIIKRLTSMTDKELLDIEELARDILTERKRDKEKARDEWYKSSSFMGRDLYF